MAHEADQPARRKTKKKGYIRLKTNLGNLNIELHCDLVPKTCENILALCKAGYYKNTNFHRSIPGFMIQGGDPTGTGRGGESVWKKPFGDEFKPQLLHSERGVLSMANSGPATNGSQFFILFKAAKHLNNKHTVFGRVVGGLEVLDAMEGVPTDPESDRPLSEIRIQDTLVYCDPFEEDEVGEQEAKKNALSEEDKRIGCWWSAPSGTGDTTSSSVVGKYLAQATTQDEKKNPNNKRPLSIPAPACDDNSGAQPPLKRQPLVGEKRS